MDEDGLRRRVRVLVDESTGDPLAPFTLRPGRQYVFSPDGHAVVGYAIRFNTLVVGGDPVGREESWPAAIHACSRLAKDRGHHLAVLGASERSRHLWAEAGLSALAIGRDVVIPVRDFSLRGRRFRNLRQAVQRTRNAGVTVQWWLEKDVPEAARAQLRAMLEDAGRDDDRGFSMILGLPFDGLEPESLIVMARDRDGKPVGAQRYLPAGARDLSLDVPVRVAGAPNGVDERLIVEAVAWAREHDIERVSLAFAPFPDLFADPDNHSLRHRAAVRLTHTLDPLIGLESLYRYLRKFHAFDQQRFVLLRPVEVLRVAAAMLNLEFSAATTRGRRAG